MFDLYWNCPCSTDTSRRTAATLQLLAASFDSMRLIDRRYYVQDFLELYLNSALFASIDGRNFKARG